MQTSEWCIWFAWRPVNLVHEYANLPATAWLCDVARKKTARGYVYALPGMEAQC